MYIDIPIENLKRATKFYQCLLNDKPIEINNMYAVFSSDTTINPCIRLVKEKSFIPGTFGILLNFNIQHNLPNLLTKIPKIGGKIISINTKDNNPIDINKNFDFACNALLRDSEGNRIAVFSNSKSELNNILHQKSFINE